MRQVKDIEDLRALARKPNCEIRLALAGGAFSRKDISYEDAGAIGLWTVYNHIDDTEQTLTDAELWTETNIGAWLDAGRVWA